MGPLALLWLVGAALAYVLAAALVGGTAMLVWRLAMLVVPRAWIPGRTLESGTLPRAIARPHKGDLS